jgi:hypothetical protein
MMSAMPYGDTVGTKEDYVEPEEDRRPPKQALRIRRSPVSDQIMTTPCQSTAWKPPSLTRDMQSVSGMATSLIGEVFEIVYVRERGKFSAV